MNDKETNCSCEEGECTVRLLGGGVAPVADCGVKRICKVSASRNDVLK